MLDTPLPRIVTVLLLLLTSALLFLTTGFRLLASFVLLAGLLPLWKWFLVTERPDDEMTNKVISCCHYLGDEDRTD